MRGLKAGVVAAINFSLLASVLVSYSIVSAPPVNQSGAVSGATGNALVDTRFLPVDSDHIADYPQTESEIDPVKLVKGAIDQWRGVSSFGEVSMTIHRPDWQRSMTMKSWTRGEKDALIRFVAPAKDAGNATLKLNNDMWMFTPKLNQVIKLPASMMTQSWMGSDFSYNDLAKSDQLLTDFELKLLSTEKVDGITRYTIEAIPKADAPVVWGKEVLVIREDNILLRETFYDQAMLPVKEMKTLKIETIGGRLYPVLMRMSSFEENDRWTQIETHHAVFNLAIPAFIFTQSNLRNPRPWSAD